MRLGSTQADGRRKSEEPKNHPTFTAIYYTVLSFSSNNTVTFSRRFDTCEGRSYHAGGWDEGEKTSHGEPRPAQRRIGLDLAYCGWRCTEVYGLHVRKCSISLVAGR
jgi:hypothetical protein